MSPRGGRMPVILLAVVDNWVMVRHPHCIPFVITKKEWDALAPWPHPTIWAPAGSRTDTSR